MIHLIPTTDNSIKYAVTKKYLKQQHHVPFPLQKLQQNFLYLKFRSFKNSIAQRF